MKNFRSYQLAVHFYQSVQNITLPKHLKDQLLRASSSIALSLAEGRGKRTLADQKRYFQIAFGSIRECQAVFDLHPSAASENLLDTLDHLAASVFKLLRNAG